MAINIPQTSSPGASFQQGFKSVNDLFSKIRQHQLEREKLQEAVRQHDQLMKQNQENIDYKNKSFDASHANDSLKSDLLRARIEHLKNGSNGISITTDPDTGQPLIQIGGSKSNSQGGTFVNPETGETVSKPTGAETTKLQNRIVGEEQLKPIIKQIIATVPQFQSGWKKGKTSLEGKANKWFGTDYEDPSIQQEGHAALSKSAESLVNLFGLNANARNVEEVKGILEPAEGESPSGYEKRVTSELNNFSQSSQTAKNQLRKGITVNKNDMSSESKKVTVYNKHGTKFMVSEKDAAKLPEGWKRG